MRTRFHWQPEVFELMFEQRGIQFSKFQHSTCLGLGLGRSGGASGVDEFSLLKAIPNPGLRDLASILVSTAPDRKAWP